MKQMQRGVSILEMLVSVLIFTIMAIGIYYFFDSGRWMYLKSESRANLQENARLTIEGMEREMRLIGFGIPAGTEVGTSVSLNPAVFLGDDNQIGFRGDVNGYNSLPTDPDPVSGATITVENPEYVCPFNGIVLLFMERGRNWQASTCSSRTSTQITVSPAAPGFARRETEIFAPAHVWYRLTPDTDGNAICDQDTATLPDYSQCLVERAEEFTATPRDSNYVPSNWQTYATNIRQLKYRYYRKTDAGPVELTTLPLAGFSSAVDIIRIELIATDRSDQAGDFQSADFITEILLRKHRY